MREINIKITEAMLEGYNITVEQLADIGGYQTKIVNPDYIPAVLDSEFAETSPAVGEPFIENTEKRIEFLAKVILANGITPLINKALEVKRLELKHALAAVDQEEKTIVEDIKSKAEIVTVE